MAVVCRGGDNTDAIGDLAEPADHQPLGRGRGEVGCDPGGPVVGRVEIEGVGIVAHLDPRVVDDGLQENGAGMAAPIRQRQGMTGVGCRKRHERTSQV